MKYLKENFTKRYCIKEWQNISEAVIASEKLVLFATYAKSWREGVLLDRDHLIKACKYYDDADTFDNFIKSAFVGVIKIDEPDNACNSAWEVKEAGTHRKGFGKIVYQLGYWLSPTHTLISDRSAMSQPAFNAWLGWSKKYSGKELDDVLHPKNNDPDDDCTVWVSNGEYKLKRHITSRMIDAIPKIYADAVNQSYKLDTYDFDFNHMQNEYKKIKNDFSDINWKQAEEFIGALKEQYFEDLI